MLFLKEPRFYDIHQFLFFHRQNYRWLGRKLLHQIGSSDLISSCNGSHWKFSRPSNGFCEMSFFFTPDADRFFQNFIIKVILPRALSSSRTLFSSFHKPSPINSLDWDDTLFAGDYENRHPVLVCLLDDVSFCFRTPSSTPL